MLRAARETAGLTRETLADLLALDAETVKSWETGKRPIVNASGKTLRALRMQLHRAGANPTITHALETAMDADLVLEQLATSEDPHRYVLGEVVMWRELAEMVMWPVTGVAPTSLPLEGTTPIRVAQPGDRATVLNALMASGDRRSPLLRRQTAFLLGRVDDDGCRSWLSDVEADTLAHAGDQDWLSGWLMRRSMAVARACAGDTDVLRRWISHDLEQDPRGPDLNVAYWSYWLTGGRAPSDEAMASAGVDRGSVGRLLQHLGRQLHTGTPYVDLTAWSVASLVRRWPRLLLDDPSLARGLGQRAERLLDDSIDYGPTRQALDRISYAAAMATEEGKS